MGITEVIAAQDAAPKRSFERERDRMLTDIGRRLDDERVRQEMSMKRWRQRSGISKRCVTYLLKGERDPKIGTLLRAASGLGLTLKVSIGRSIETGVDCKEQCESNGIRR